MNSGCIKVYSLISKPLRGIFQNVETENRQSSALRSTMKKNARDVERTLDEAMAEAGVRLTVEHAKDDIDQLRQNVKNMRIREDEVQ
jgi:type II secretory pathway component PulM